jgi:hypothetical protein
VADTFIVLSAVIGKDASAVKFKVFSLEDAVAKNLSALLVATSLEL